MRNNTEPSGLYPWYVHVFGGWCFGGLFPWFLVVRKFFTSNKKKRALLFAGVNLLIYFAIVFYGFTSRLPWETLSLSVIIAGLLWSISAWLTQYFCFGCAPKRFYLSEWKSWFTPIFVAITLGVGCSVVYSVFPMMTNRIVMYQSPDLLTKELILWDFFKFIPLSFFISLPLGIWWAGERKQFSITFVISYLFGTVLFYLLYTCSSLLFIFLVKGGNLNQAVIPWQVLPVYPDSLQKFLTGFLGSDYSMFFIAPLVLGFTPRIRDFFLKTLIYFPLLCISILGYYGYSYQFWQIVQSQILYQMSSDLPEKQRQAYERVELLLSRFPQHRGWPAIGLELANYKYFQGDTQKAHKFYNEVHKKADGTIRWSEIAELSKTILTTDNFGKKVANVQLELPLISYESYMTSNWMALLRVMRYYEQKTTPESETLIKLQGLSSKENEIKLESMPTLAELDDNAANLGYKSVLFPANLSLVRKLITKGYPVIQPDRHSFILLYGIDESRSVVQGVRYRNISWAVARANEESLANISLRNEAEHESEVGKQFRINELAKMELPFSFWGNSRQKDTGPTLAVVIPVDEFDQLAAKLGESQESISLQSEASTTAIISFAAFKSGDIAGTIRWAMKSYSLQQEAFPLYAAYLAQILWDSRNTFIGNAFLLEEQFPALLTINEFLNRPDTKNFLDIAKAKFLTDRDTGRLPWIIRDQYIDFLDQVKKSDREIMISLLETTVANEPDSKIEWARLAELHEWDKNLDKAIYAYNKTLNSGLWDDQLAIHLAYLNVQANRYEEAELLIKAISRKLGQYNPDYYYARAEVENWKGHFAKAGKDYKQAIKMRRYNPNYHLAYANYLEARNKDPKEVQKLRSWAAQLNMSEMSEHDPGPKSLSHNNHM